MERYIGTLPKLVKSQSQPYKSLAFAVARAYKSEPVTSFAELHAPEDWIEATGHRGKDTSASKGEYSLSSMDASNWALLPPRDKPAFLQEAELEQMKIVINLAGGNPASATVYAKKYFRLRLRNGAIAGSSRASSDADTGRRRSNLVRILSTARRRRPSGAVENYEVNVYGLVDHYALVIVGGEAVPYAYIECVKSAADCAGQYGLAEHRQGLEWFSSFGGQRRYVDARAVDTVMGTLCRDARHYLLFNRERFSTEAT